MVGGAKDKMKGVKIYGSLVILLGVYGIVSILLSVFSGTLEASRNFSIITPTIYVSQILVGFNLIKYKNWARIIAVIMFLLGIPFIGAVFFLIPIKTNPLSVIMWPIFCLSVMAVMVSAVVYLNKKKVKEKFS